MTSSRRFIPEHVPAALWPPAARSSRRSFTSSSNAATSQRGFARVRCDHCEHEYLLAFSCKSRWFCPSCHQKNVQTSARFILDHVVAPVPHRHYVLAIPRMLRPYFQRHRQLLKRLCALAQESLTEYLRTALDCPKGVRASS